LHEVCRRAKNFSLVNSNKEITTLPRLFQNEEELHEFRVRHQSASVPRGDHASYCRAAFLGINAGSTTTKLVLTGENDELLYTFYESNKGSTLQSVLGGKVLYRQLPKGVYIAKTAVTGYGEGLIQSGLQADIGEVERLPTTGRRPSFCLMWILSLISAGRT
jgi:activator of 2-hydroxyglutaryl-CoA dehydratase